MTSPASNARSAVRYATPGVGSTPALVRCAPSDATPRASASSIQTPDSRVSRPASSFSSPDLGNARTSAAPSRVMVAASSGYFPASPRTPSVPNSLLMIALALESRRLPDSHLHGRRLDVLH